jgi:predicted PurR-regulated permease PerM
MLNTKNKMYFWPILLVLVFLLLYYFFNLVMYIAIASVLMLVSAPIHDFLENLKIGKTEWKIPTWIISLKILLLFYIFFGLIILAIIPELLQQARSLSALDLSLFKQKFDFLFFYSEKIYYAINPDTNLTLIEFLQDKLVKIFNTNLITSTIRNAVSLTGSTFTAFFSVSFILFFLNKDKSLIKLNLLNLVPLVHRETISNILNKSRQTLSRYFIGVFIQVCGVFILLSIGLTLFGIQNAIFIAFVAAILNIIPYIGPLIGLGFGMFIVITSSITTDLSFLFSNLLKTFIVMASTQVIDNVVFQPLIFSKSIVAHPLEIFLVIIAAGTLYGILGMLVAIPLYSVIRIIIQQILLFMEKNKMTEI